MLQTTDQINSFSEEREAIETRFTNQFDTQIAPVQFGNISVLKKGAVSIPTPYKGDAFVRVNLLGGDGQQREVTRLLTTMNGIISITVFTSQDVGTQMARSLVDQIFPIFNAVKFNGITTGAASVREIPPNNGWYAMNISVPYTWYYCNNG